MSYDNTPKRICSEVVYSEKVQRISDMKWAGQSHNVHSGICQFCNNILQYSYRVFKESDVVLPRKEGKLPPCFEVETGSPGDMKAQGYVDENSAPEGTHVFALSCCEEMTSEALFYHAMEHYGKRVEDWREKQEKLAAERVAKVETLSVPAGKGWGNS